MNTVCILWFRQDLRLSDNPAFFQAKKQYTIFPVYIFDRSVSQKYAIGSAGKWWLHHALHDLNASLNGALNVYRGNPVTILQKLAKQYSVDALFYNQCYEPSNREHQQKVAANMERLGIDIFSFNGSLLWHPEDVVKKDGIPYKVFTPFYRNGCLKSAKPRAPLAKPRSIATFRDKKNKTTIDSLKLINRSHDYAKYWQVGEQSAQKKLKQFLKKSLSGYAKGRDYPALPNVSELSPYLHFGNISPNQIWYAVGQSKAPVKDKQVFLSQLGWREFSYNLLYHFPTIGTKNFKSHFNAFAWRKSKKLLSAWRDGKTGYPLADAGMRQLKQMGYMHNRVRMIVGSLLVKNMLIHWHEGRDWFWQNLLDADLANNSVGWQWVAGSGPDAAPYFRIFNPVTQSKKFDPKGDYIRMWVPELTDVPHKYIFEPWKMPDDVQEQIGVVIGKNYPEPIVDLSVSRKKALALYKKSRK